MSEEEAELAVEEAWLALYRLMAETAPIEVRDTGGFFVAGGAVEAKADVDAAIRAHERARLASAQGPLRMTAEQESLLRERNHPHAAWEAATMRGGAALVVSVSDAIAEIDALRAQVTVLREQMRTKP